MKRMVQAGLLFSGLVCGAAAATADDGVLVDVDARYVFAPTGFDDNDEAMIVIDGYLPSGCYRLAEPEVAVDPARGTIQVTPKARYFDIPCIEALIPYFQEIRLGRMPQGQLRISVGPAAITETLRIAQALTASPDDHLYAPIDEVAVQRDPATDGLFATLRGRFTDSCMAWDGIQALDHGKTVDVLPVMKMNDEGCVAGEFPFEARVDLPDSIRAGRHLLHVRSLNGKAVNAVFGKNP
jgi:hypothetical protein